MRRVVLTWVAVFAICLAVQATIVVRMGLWGARPDLVFVALFVFALRYGSLPAIYVGFVVGLCQDLYSPAVLGQNALCKTVSGYFFGLFNERVMSTDPVVKMVILFLGFMLHDLLFWGIDTFAHGSSVVSVAVNLAVRTLPRAVYSMLCAILYYAWERARNPAAELS